MSVSNAARLRVAIAVVLVVAVVIALVARASHHGHRTASPAPVTAPSETTTTQPAAGSSTAAPGGADATSTTVTTGVATDRPSTGARATGPFANGTPTRLDVPAGAPLDPLPPPDAGWSPLSVVQGTGNGSYATFSITSPTTQVRFRSSAGQFHIFVVDQAQGREATAGYADVDCVGPCADLQTLSVPRGSYHVEVDADGPWELSLEEYR